MYTTTCRPTPASAPGEQRIKPRSGAAWPTVVDMAVRAVLRSALL